MVLSPSIQRIFHSLAHVTRSNNKRCSIFFVGESIRSVHRNFQKGTYIEHSLESVVYKYQSLIHKILCILWSQFTMPSLQYKGLSSEMSLHGLQEVNKYSSSWMTIWVFIKTLSNQVHHLRILNIGSYPKSHTCPVSSTLFYIEFAIYLWFLRRTIASMGTYTSGNKSSHT